MNVGKNPQNTACGTPETAELKAKIAGLEQELAACREEMAFLEKRFDKLNTRYNAEMESLFAAMKDIQEVDGKAYFDGHLAAKCISRLRSELAGYEATVEELSRPIESQIAAIQAREEGRVANARATAEATITKLAANSERLVKRLEEAETKLEEAEADRDAADEAYVTVCKHKVEVEGKLAEAEGAVVAMRTALKEASVLLHEFTEDGYIVDEHGWLGRIDAALSPEAGKVHMERDRLRDEALRDLLVAYIQARTGAATINGWNKALIEEETIVKRVREALKGE